MHFFQHLNSNIHQGANVSCPFCRRAYTSASGVSHHLETGSCPNARNINRKFIYEQLAQRDQQGIITKKLIGWHEETWHTGNAWNGSFFECYLCHKQFNRNASLDQHLKSPTHLQNIYHCPSRSCGSNFRTLASMFNHLESEKCGFIKFAGVNKNVNNFFSSNRQIAFT